MLVYNSVELWRVWIGIFTLKISAWMFFRVYFSNKVNKKNAARKLTGSRSLKKPLYDQGKPVIIFAGLLNLLQAREKQLYYCSEPVDFHTAVFCNFMETLTLIREKYLINFLCLLSGFWSQSAAQSQLRVHKFWFV